MSSKPEQFAREPNPPADPTSVGGTKSILVATVVAGVSAYILLAILGKALTPERFATFSVVWGILYFLVGAITGVQQEFSRATHAKPPNSFVKSTGWGAASKVGVAGAIVIGLVVFIVSAIFLNMIVHAGNFAMSVGISVAIASYTLTTVFAGTLYGLCRWRAIAWLIMSDALLRFIGVLLVTLLNGSDTALVLAVSAPFVLSPLLVWLFVRAGVVGQSTVDVRPVELVSNSLRAIIATLALSLLTGGLPVLLAVSAPGVPAATLGATILIITLSRAPLLTPILALQSLLVVTFRNEKPAAMAVRLKRYISVLAIGTVVLAGLAFWLGPTVAVFVFGADYLVNPWVIASAVISAGCLGAIALAGVAAIATARYSLYTFAWIVSLVVTALGFLLPLPFELRTSIALVVGPIFGLSLLLGLVFTGKSVGDAMSSKSAALKGS